MAVSAPLVNAASVIGELDLSEQEFAYEHDGQETPGLNARVTDAIRRASRRVQQSVGGNYTSTDALTIACLRDGEFALACALMLRQRLNILNGRPEEAPPPEYIHPELIGEQIAEYLGDFETAIAPYRSSEDFDKPGTAFAFGAVGVDETKADVSTGGYDSTDFGELPSE